MATLDSVPLEIVFELRDGGGFVQVGRLDHRGSVQRALEAERLCAVMAGGAYHLLTGSGLTVAWKGELAQSAG